PSPYSGELARLLVCAPGLKAIQAGAQFGDFPVLLFDGRIDLFGPAVHTAAPTATGLKQGSMAIPPYCLRIEASVDLREADAHLGVKRVHLCAYRLDLAFEAFPHGQDQLNEIFHEMTLRANSNIA